MRAPRRPRVGVWSFTSCEGCQMRLLELEGGGLGLFDRFEVAYFPEATRSESPGPLDLAVVEGSVSTPQEAERIQEVRARTRELWAIGACATAGGIQALRNFMNLDELARLVYAAPEYVETLETSTAIADHVNVDLELRGCPLDAGQLEAALAAFLDGRRLSLPAHAVCLECKLGGNPCLLVAGGRPCLGPATQAGCGALCPAFGRGCFGCFGPMEAAQPEAMRRVLVSLGLSEDQATREFRRFAAAAPAFAGGGRRP
ncbi:MAG TPA: oxidoreductase [Anaeromyxobacteraceae bacterium]|nr:oxidoreductase [Anaeromyxobacteraceae bacterium]